ncbi:MAG: hypothetical protein R6U85_00670 [Salinivirgaceae bacterium]
MKDVSGVNPWTGTASTAAKPNSASDVAALLKKELARTNSLGTPGMSYGGGDESPIYIDILFPEVTITATKVTSTASNSWFNTLLYWARPIPVLGASLSSGANLEQGNYVAAGRDFAYALAELATLGYASNYTVPTRMAAKGSKSFVQFSSKTGISKGGQKVFSHQARFSKPNLNARLDRGFRAPFKNTTSPYLGKPYNGFNTHINIQKPGSFNYHFPLNPLKWKYYNIP